YLAGREAPSAQDPERACGAGRKAAGKDDREGSRRLRHLHRLDEREPRQDDLPGRSKRREVESGDREEDDDPSPGELLDDVPHLAVVRDLGQEVRERRDDDEGARAAQRNPLDHRPAHASEGAIVVDSPGARMVTTTSGASSAASLRKDSAGSRSVSASRAIPSRRYVPQWIGIA